MLRWDRFPNGDVPELVLGLSMSPVQPMMNCSCVADSERMPLIIAEWPWRAERDHRGIGGSPGAWSDGGEAVSEDNGRMLAGCWGGVAGGESMPGREDAWRVAVTGR